MTACLAAQPVTTTIASYTEATCSRSRIGPAASAYSSPGPLLFSCSLGWMSFGHLVQFGEQVPSKNATENATTRRIPAGLGVAKLTGLQFVDRSPYRSRPKEGLWKPSEGKPSEGKPLRAFGTSGRPPGHSEVKKLMFTIKTYQTSPRFGALANSRNPDSLWKHLEAFWKPLEASGSLRKHLEAFGSLWKLLEACGSLWKHLEAFGSLWKLLEA